MLGGFCKKVRTYQVTKFHQQDENPPNEGIFAFMGDFVN